MKLKLLTIIAALSTSTAFAETCEKVQENQNEYGKSFLNGLTLESVDHRTIGYPELKFSDFYNESMQIVGQKQIRMYEVEENGSVVKFKNNYNRYAERENMGEYYKGRTYQVIVEKVSETEFDVSFYKARTEGGARSLKYIFDKDMGKNLIQGDDKSMPIRYKATDESLQRVKTLKCSE